VLTVLHQIEQRVIKDININSNVPERKRKHEPLTETKGKENMNLENIDRENEKRRKHEPLTETKCKENMNCEENTERENETCTNKIQLSEGDHDDMEKILTHILENGAPENFRHLLDSQLQNCKKGLEIHHRRWDHKLISVCLGIYMRSPRAYEDLKKSGLLVLPSKRLIQYYKNSI